ncbi:thiamine pyrophosphate-binding protein [Nocardia terpenica]|uniref:thiamine pyrophosphate-binding protein n=1 Tax=Nocardia terpenica TaxID=455432 RepID=UPI0018946A45|nr:thiamine pyrophosphate-binding protein [Nocardia terpenica]MBF6063377.1 thiamine pyrophosphate-binding protein [Nocardia terpenica]MBF6105933.1 thiamine pyrophosphate-binding protein [Nocardia terpenica]MBF6113483.1 thiamine pyrophosphate-binding protein [Nocardia terpenica]MBF6119674.1 thiamine pyrophosphate-binding protein [Nocardia terpenica]MBF6152085.1 thiamine pyrophosphate-binding protein [Nocardia terpenica]
MTTSITRHRKLGRDLVFDYLREAGVEYAFGVPGTHEIPLIDGTTVPANGVSYIPCLHENIAVGAAMGYARMSGRPGAAIVHVTPGTANIIDNLFNAYRSNIPLIVFCGQQHSDLLSQEPILGSDLVRTAGQYTKWAHEVRTIDELPLVLQRAFKELSVPPLRPVFLAIPWNFLVESPTTPDHGRFTRIAHRSTGDPAGISAVADRLARASNPALLVGDGVGEAGAWPEIEQLANLLGAAVYSENQASRMNYPNDLPHWQGELMPTQDGVHKQLGDFDVLFQIGVNSQAQVLVFRWADGPIIPDRLTQVTLHNDPWEIGKNHFADVGVLGDIKMTLPLIIDAVVEHPGYDETVAGTRNQRILMLDAQRATAFSTAAQAFPGDDEAPIPDFQVPMVLAELQQTLRRPLTIVNEDFAVSPTIQQVLHYDHPDAYFCTSGGALGFSLPASIGIALAVGQERLVVDIVGDGSALFHTNSWWTTRKFHLPVLYLVMNNHEYKSLINGLQSIEALYGWRPAHDAWYLRLGQPVQDFAQIAATFGIDGEVVSDGRKLRDAIEHGLKVVSDGEPYVIDIRVDPSVGAAPPTDMLLVGKPGIDVDEVRRLRAMGPP